MRTINCPRTGTYFFHVGVFLFCCFLLMVQSIGFSQQNGSAGLARLASLSPDKKIHQYVYDNWNIEDGLPSDAIWAITQTNDGYIWLATYGGLVRFNGVTFSVFDRDNTPQFTHNRMLSLCADRDGGLWIGTEDDGLCRYRDGRFRKFTVDDGIHETTVNALIQDRSGQLWVGGTTGIARYRNNRFEYLNPGGKNMNITAIHEDDRGVVWFADWGKGLYRYQDGEIAFFGVAEGLSGFDIHSLCSDNDGHLMVGTIGRGLSRLVGDTFVPDTRLVNSPVNSIRCMYRDRAGTLWLGTRIGIAYLRGDDLDLFSRNNGFVDDRVQAIFEDREGNLWVGVYKGGLCRFKDGCIRTFFSGNGTLDSRIWAVFEDRDGVIWVGTEQNGLKRMTGDTVTTMTVNDGLPSNKVQAFTQDEDGNIWIGTAAGVARYNDGKVTQRFFTSTRSTRQPVRYIYEAPSMRGRIWLGTDSGGLKCLKNDTLFQFTLPGLVDESVISWIKEDPTQAGVLWICSSRGLIKLHVESEKMTLYTTADGLSTNRLCNGYIDPRGIMWISTMGGGLNRIKNGRISYFTTSNGFLDDAIWSIYEDKRQTLWMSSDKGIFFVKKQQLNDFADGKITAFHTESFGIANGLKSAECNGSGNPVMKKSGSPTLWYPTMNGLACLDFSRIRKNTIQPPVYIEEVRIDRRNQVLPADAEISAWRRDFEFHFTALSFRDPTGVAIKYRLEGYDSHWVKAGTKRVAHYTNLSPGSYRFRVIAANEDGLWNQTGASISFSIKAPFHHRWWFLVLFYGLIAFLLFHLYRRRVAGMEKKIRRLEDQARDEQRAEDDLTHMQILLTDIIDSMPSVLIGVDGEGCVTHWNAEAVRLTEIQANDAFGHHIADLYPDFKSELESMQTAIVKRIPQRNQKVIRRVGKDTRYSTITIYPLAVEGVEGAVIRIDDVTELANKEAQLRQAQKMETVGTLASGLAHDFNNILGGIIGTLTLARFKLDSEGEIPKDELDDYFSMMEECGERATHMVKQLLTLSREQELEFAPVDLNLTIKQVMKICRSSLHKSIDIKAEFRDHPAMVNADPTQLGQVLLNFCVNADHAMTIMREPDKSWGGTLSVGLERMHADSHFCAIHPEAREIDYWNLSVKDEGVGMDSETASRIFNPFFTRKEKGKGTGLGLAMAYSIVEQHQGFISFFSSEGVGTTFNIYLPLLSHKLIPVTRKSASQSAEIPRGEGLVLVVDDELIMRRIARSVLETCGYEVVCVENGKEGVDTFALRYQEIKVVLLDVAMPKLSGNDAFIRMKEIDPNVKVLLASGFKQDARIKEMIQLGVKAFIQKPFTLKKLANAIHKVSQS